MSAYGADQPLHVSSTASAQKTHSGHYAGSRLTCSHEVPEDRDCFPPLTVQKGYASLRNRCLLALPGQVASARSRQGCLYLGWHYVANLLSESPQVRCTVRICFEPASGRHLATVSAPVPKHEWRPREPSHGGQSQPCGVVDVGESAWLEKTAYAVKGSAPDHHGHCNDEVNIN